MKECKDMDPARTDRVSVWIYIKHRIKNHGLLIPIGIKYIKQKIYRGDILTNFKF